MAIVRNHEFVILEETAPVGHREKSDFELFGLEVQLCLDVHAHRAGAFVQNGEDGFVVEESSHGYSLFLTTWKHIVPVVDRVEAFLSFFNVVQLHPFQQLTDFFISMCDSFPWVRVDYLVSQGTRREVGTLWNVKQFIHMWSFEHSTRQWPKTAKDSKQRWLSAAVGASDDRIHAWFNLKGNLLDQDVAVGWDDWHFIKHDVIFSFLGDSDVDGVDIVLSLHDVLVDYLSPDEFSPIEVSKNFLHFVDECGISS